MQENISNITLKLQHLLDDVALTTSRRNEFNALISFLHQKATKADELQSQIDELRTKLKDNGDNIQ